MDSSRQRGLCACSSLPCTCGAGGVETHPVPKHWWQLLGGVTWRTDAKRRPGVGEEVRSSLTFPLLLLFSYLSSPYIPVSLPFYFSPPRCLHVHSLVSPDLAEGRGIWLGLRVMQKVHSPPVLCTSVSSAPDSPLLPSSSSFLLILKPQRPLGGAWRVRLDRGPWTGARCEKPTQQDGL